MTPSSVHRGLLIDLLALDAEPGPRHHLASVTRAERSAALCRFLQALEAAKVPGSEQIARSAADAPDVFASPGAYQWLLGAIAALTADHGEVGRRVAIAVEAAWPLVAGASLACSGQWEGEVRRIDPTRESVVLPAVDIALTDVSIAATNRLLSMDDRRMPGQLPQRGGLVIDPFDPSLTFRARETFRFPTVEEAASRLASWTAEVEGELDLIERLCPPMASRLLGRLVPVHAMDVDRAATHENVPEVTFISFGRSPGGLGAALAHEEVHAVLNELEQCGLYTLPDPADHLEVGWRPDPRPVKAVIHGIAAFGRMGQYWHAVAGETDQPHAKHQAVEQAGWVASAIDRLGKQVADLPSEVSALLEHFAGIADRVLAAHPSSSTNGPAAAHAAEADGGVPADDDHAATPEVIARSGKGAPFTWLLVEGLLPVEIAYGIVHEQARFPWRRRTTSFYQQEVCALANDDPGARGGAVDAVVARVLPALCDLLDADVTVTDLELHRLRPGDHIDTHTDAQATGLSHRVVIGLDPFWDAAYGGQLGLHSGTTSHPSVQLLPPFAGAAILRIGGRSFHEVAAIRGPYPRLTLILSLGEDEVTPGAT